MNEGGIKERCLIIILYTPLLIILTIHDKSCDCFAITDFALKLLPYCESFKTLTISTALTASSFPLEFQLKTSQMNFIFFLVRNYREKISLMVKDWSEYVSAKIT